MQLPLLPLLLVAAQSEAASPAPGYTLFSPLHDTSTYLIDLDGKVVHRWASDFEPGNAVYLLDDGSLLRCARAGGNEVFRGGGEGGRIQRIGWDGELLWDFPWSDASRLQHHDVEPMPNGNVLLISWEHRSGAEALAAGRAPELLRAGELWPDAVFEIAPEPPTGGRVVWEWHAWDHLVQERDPALPNFGAVAAHPELIDLNGEVARQAFDPREIAELQELGYVGDDDGETQTPPTPPRDGPGFGGADWLHINSIDYHPVLDQIVLSVHNFHEIWVIDHSTTSAEAAAHAGGRAGRGGDLLYRWGNPRAWGAGTAADQRLFAQHDAQWIEPGLPGAGHLLIFNNGVGRARGNWSSVDEIEIPLDDEGRYRIAPGTVAPLRACWSYSAAERGSFFASHISGAQRLPNGNTLICSGEDGRFFEVTPAGQQVWEYRNPFGARPGPPGGEQPGFGGGPPPARPLLGPPPGGGPGGPGRRGPGPRGGNGVFRATRIAAAHPGLARLAAE